MVGELEEYSTHSMVMIYISLTDHGYENREKVLDAIFSYLLLLKTSGPNKEYYERLQKRNDVKFKFLEEKAPLGNVVKYGVNMRHYAPKDVITGEFLYMDYDEEEIGKIIDMLNEKKFNILFMTDRYEDFDKREKWYGTEYAAAGECFFKLEVNSIRLTWNTSRFSWEVQWVVDQQIFEGIFLYSQQKSVCVQWFWNIL